MVLVDDAGRPVGVAAKDAVHASRTPRHLGFSCYGFDEFGRTLVTRRSPAKRTFPGVWTNTCCGHPAPDEPLEQAVRRRLDHELGMRPTGLRLVLPDFSYRAGFEGIEENELCPVFVCRLVGDPRPHPDEVLAYDWWSWDRFLAAAVDDSSGLSPWSRLQAPLLDADPMLRSPSSPASKDG